MVAFKRLIVWAYIHLQYIGCIHDRSKQLTIPDLVRLRDSEEECKSHTGAFEPRTFNIQFFSLYTVFCHESHCPPKLWCSWSRCPNVFYLGNILATQAWHNMSKTKFMQCFSIKTFSFPDFSHFSWEWKH